MLHIENYFKRVILPSIARKQVQSSVQSISDLKQLLGSNNSNNSLINVPLPVLAQKNNNNNNSSNNNNYHTNNNHSSKGEGKKVRERKISS